MNVSVFGLGKLGLPLAVFLAEHGHSVIGLDTNGQLLSAITGGVNPLPHEPGVGEALDRLRGPNSWKLVLTVDPGIAVRGSDISFIVVPTPSRPTGEFTPRFVLDAAQAIGTQLSAKEGYHLVVIVSTVMPGDSYQVQETLEQYSGKKCGDAFGLCYNPEFIALGSVLQNLERPDFILIGESDKRAGDLLRQFHWETHLHNFDGSCYVGPRFVRTSFINAELAKLCLNAYVTMKMSFANEIGALCTRIPGANVDEVLGAIGHDSRIGKKYLKAGTAWGGPCFPRDGKALRHVAHNDSVMVHMSAATDNVNGKTTFRLFETIMAQKPESIGIIGLAYKPGSNVVEASASVALLDMLAQAGGVEDIYWYDPALPNGNLLEEVLAQDVVVLMHQVDEALWQRVVEAVPRVIVDPWRQITIDNPHLNITLIQPGIGPKEDK